jgi:pyridinium-3,5-bisthiocarboxylic acid mononucleotide nickel chelatase
MRTLYFDCFAGISGDMTLGALVAAGVDAFALKEHLALLDLAGYEISFEQVERAGIGATRAVVRTEEEKSHRHLSDISEIILRSRLVEPVKERAVRIFTRLAEAEARVHNIAVERVHFHEVGAVDAIVDVVGACIGFELLGVERFVASPLHVGSGTVEMAHGRFPVPPPAVADLLRGANVYSTDIRGELVTPTGAAIVATLCESFGPVPPMRLLSTGYGAGAREYEKFPNVLRVLVGESEREGEGVVEDEGARDEELAIVETNVDDVSPQVLGYVLELALARGALDCYLTPVQMKKNRPGVLLSVLAPESAVAVLEAVLFRETETFGVRRYPARRSKLRREAVTVETPWGPVRGKRGWREGGPAVFTPEYEDCARVARQHGVALREVYAAVRKAYEQRAPAGH